MTIRKGSWAEWIVSIIGMVVLAFVMVLARGCEPEPDLAPLPLPEPGEHSVMVPDAERA